MTDALRWGLTDQDLAILREALARNPHIQRALIFGSRAKGTFHRGSDVDLALCGDELTREDLVQTSDYLNEEIPLPYRFDVLDRARLTNKELSEHIDRVGQEIYRRE
jgi:predicted nucleotidyltransferase